MAAEARFALQDFFRGEIICGIAGLIHPNSALVRSATQAMTDAQRHRGPDADGLDVLPFGNAFVALGHRRLKILDLSPLGRQPMVDPGSGNVLVFNGEIYNFSELKGDLAREGVSFRSTGDTEVLLQALTRWGVPQTLRRLEGMFAFAFLDRRRKTLTVARDPLGIKPLYLAETTGGGIAFASEVRALLKTGLVSRKIDRRGLAGYLAFGAVQHPFTLFEGVRSLTPGAFQEFTAADEGWKTAAAQAYWSFPPVKSDLHEADALSLVRQTVDLAVRDHLIADVPVGVFLSGGLDSTIIAGLAAKYSPGIQGFTVGFSDQPDLSEMSLAGETAKRFGIRHVPINITGGEAEAAAADWLSAADLPSIDGLNTFVISQAVRREGIKVALSGLGADELFGGYPSFRDLPRLMRMRRRMGWLPAGARRGLAGVLTARKTQSVRRKLSDMMSGKANLTELYFYRRRLLPDCDLADLELDAESLGLSGDFQKPNGTATVDESDAIRAVSELESRFYQGNMLLRDGDVMSMAHGLEIRVPFLDRRLLDCGHAMPGEVRLPAGAPGKHLLRRAFADLLRPELTNRPKTGFTLPLAQWMLGPLRDLCQRSLAACTEQGGLPVATVSRVWEEFASQHSGSQGSRALSLVVLGNYLEQNGAG